MNQKDDYWEGGLERHPDAVAPAKLILVMILTHAVLVGFVTYIVAQAVRVPTHRIWMVFWLLSSSGVVGAPLLAWAHQAPGPKALTLRLTIWISVYMEAVWLTAVLAAIEVGLVSGSAGLKLWFLGALCAGVCGAMIRPMQQGWVPPIDMLLPGAWLRKGSLAPRPRRADPTIEDGRPRVDRGGG